MSTVTLGHRLDADGTEIASDGLVGGDKEFDALMQGVHAAAVSSGITREEWGNVLKFIKENLWTEENMMKEYESGKAVGVRQTSDLIQFKLNERAAKLFIAASDTEAERMRSLAKEIPTWTAK